MVFLGDEKEAKKLGELRAEEQEDLAKLLSQKYTIPYLDLSKMSIDTDALRIVDEKAARAAGFAPFSSKGKNYDALISSPKNEQLPELLESLKNKGLKISLFIGSNQSLERAWARYAELAEVSKTQGGLIDISVEELTHFLSKIKDTDALKKEIEETISPQKALLLLNFSHFRAVA